MSHSCQYLSVNEKSSEGTPLDTISLTGQALLICLLGVEMGASPLFVHMKAPKGARDPMSRSRESQKERASKIRSQESE